MPQEKKPINQNLTVPNALSVLRIIVIPFFAWFFMHDQLAIAVALLVLSGLSDCVDGFIARKLNQVTELGKMLDPWRTSSPKAWWPCAWPLSSRLSARHFWFSS